MITLDGDQKLFILSKALDSHSRLKKKEGRMRGRRRRGEGERERLVIMTVYD